MSAGACAFFALASIVSQSRLQELEVARDVLGGGALGGGADDHAAGRRGDLLDDRLQAVALVVVEPARDAEPVAVRDVDDEAAGQRDLGRQAGALRLHRVLDRLDEHGLAALDQVLDLAGAAAALELGADDLVDVEEAVLLEADLDERRLHPGQHVVDRAEVDVAGDRAVLGPLEVDLGDDAVLDHGDALLARVDRDEQLALGLRQRRAARCGAARRPRRAARARRFALRLASRPGVAPGSARAARRRRLASARLCGRRRRRGAGLLLAPAPAAAAAAALLRLVSIVRPRPATAPAASGAVGGSGSAVGTAASERRLLRLRLLAAEPG